MDDLTYAWRGPLDDVELADLTVSHGGEPAPGWWDRVSGHSLGWVTARDAEGVLVGFVNVAWDGGDHAFLLDTKTRGDRQRSGIGTALVRRAVEEAEAAGCAWIEVDFEPHLRGFYLDACGFRPTEAGLIRLQQAPPTGTEGAVFGPWTSAEIGAFLRAYVRDRLGTGIARVRFRSGRIDAVWGVDLDDGRAVVVKTHRPPVDLEALRVVVDALAVLSAAGFPCPKPLSGPDEVDGHVLTVQTLLTGDVPDGRDPAVRGLLADGLVQHVELLRARPDLVGRAGPGPSWCRYQAGPWPVPHDSMIDFSSTPSGYGWLDDLGARAADQVLANHEGAPVVVGHADWYAGNTVVAGGRLTGTFDWELVADTEAVLAGFAAAGYGASQTSPGGLSSPEEVVAFLRDYERFRGAPFSAPERHAAAGAAAWICAFNARWQVALHEQGRSDDWDHVLRVRERQTEYLDPPWT